MIKFLKETVHFRNSETSNGQGERIKETATGAIHLKKYTGIALTTLKVNFGWVGISFSSIPFLV